MQSFRTEIENPVVEQDILDLEKKIRQFREGKADEEKFRSLRLARGVYGQRQSGVQMVRIKLPFGKVTSEQLHRIADVSDEYSTGRLHITTRQDIQIHFVSLDRTPELWAQLEKDDVTLREACGNTVRNITASPDAGIDPKEPFDVSPYAEATFKFFLRNPICQEMGRKFKIAFSSSDDDTALSYIHDLGFIPKIQDGKRGFKVMLGGGLGSQPRHADVLSDFIPTEEIIPLTEGVLRVFDRYGERAKRLKARMKFLIKDIGREAFLELVEEQKTSLSGKQPEFEIEKFEAAPPLQNVEAPSVNIEDQKAFETWKNTNVAPQKQEGLFSIGIRVPLGDFYTGGARKLADLIKKYAGNELRLTLRQDILIRHVREEFLPFFYSELKELGYAEAGYNKTVDITACPGTDTCNLGIASSTGIADVLEDVLKEEFPNFVNGRDITIKISGCMNACGQHNMAEIGFQGMSIKSGKAVAPALQVLLGGGVLGNGEGRFADKVVKVPSKRGPEALRILLKDFEANAENDEKYVNYYDRQGKTYFYDLLKDLADTSNLTENDFIDWGHEKPYIKAVGVGECAGVVIDLVATLLFESEEKIDNAKSALERGAYSDSIYHAYSSIVNSAKALLTAEDIKTNTHAGIISQFDESYVETGKIELSTSFKDFVYQMKENEPTKAFAEKYIEDASLFLKRADAYRTREVQNV
ncbi:HEPN domain-containing protein [Christiangramia flava]|uniref:Ferredoxin--sulfite reductase n=1 Tax=Christiangramia flava JLT2011 TaxID=1229726 RepID=A0A1L7I5F1_9FLAO|nr:HEPN domain-containing protein [Christiangramia flava]APU68831.1 Ferredoxin--sulfite reductase [Christiangramia flava JLT2011]OSS39024.1 Ferredoxin--sulfite reductase [Christiangramia flava JLT2011]